MPKSPSSCPRILLTVYCLVLFMSATPLLAQVVPRFEEYPVALYSGAIHAPKWIRQADSGEWRDNLDKLVEPPEINFAGKYFIADHSCGTGCRYYTMTDLSSGRDLNVLKEFAAAEPPPKTRDGYKYITDLIIRASSKMLVAQYHVELRGRNEECRERTFIFERERLAAISKIRRTCTRF